MNKITRKEAIKRTVALGAGVLGAGLLTSKALNAFTEKGVPESQEAKEILTNIVEGINNVMDYESLSRQVLKSYTLENATILRYERDEGNTVFFINENKKVKTIKVGQYVYPSEFVIHDKIDLKKYEGKGNEAINTLAHSLINQENDLLFKLMTAASKYNENIPLSFMGQRDDTKVKSFLEETQYKIERHRQLIDKFIVGDPIIRAMKKEETANLDYTPIGNRDLLETGMYGSIWGVNIFKSEHKQVAKTKSIFAVTEGMYLGVQPIRFLTAIPNEEHDELIAICQMSMCILNPRAVAHGKM